MSFLKWAELGTGAVYQATLSCGHVEPLKISDPKAAAKIKAMVCPRCGVIKFVVKVSQSK